MYNHCIMLTAIRNSTSTTIECDSLITADSNNIQRLRVVDDINSRTLYILLRL